MSISGLALLPDDQVGSELFFALFTPPSHSRNMDRCPVPLVYWLNWQVAYSAGRLGNVLQYSGQFNQFTFTAYAD
jgi:hypothetical protein